MQWILLVCAVARGDASSGSASLISFPGATWVEVNDPIMGGKSHGNWSVVDKSYGLFQGSVENVPSLAAPGFCRAVTVSVFSKDASAYLDGGLLVTARTTTPEYKGFRLTFGSLSTPKHHNGHEIEGSFKATLNVPASANGEWQTVFMKFSDFSYDWSDFTGECSTKDPDGYQHRCCTTNSTDVCPTAKLLQGIASFNIWAEGVAGDFQLELKEIVATASPKFGLVIV